MAAHTFDAADALAISDTGFLNTSRTFERLKKSCLQLQRNRKCDLPENLSFDSVIPT